jgi:hypothetical protein
MELNDDVFSFEDFLAGKVQKPATKSVKKFVESVVDKTEEEATEIKEPEPAAQDEMRLPTPEKNSYEEEEEEDPIYSEEESVQPVIVEENFYPLYKDKSENFSCDIYVEGAKTDETITRLIVETNEWTLMFPGEINSGKVNIPIRKLNIFEEGQIGTIRLEVIAEGTIFIPWEDQFKVKLSKKVSVSLNENKKIPIQKKPEVGVKVNIRK